MAQRSLLTLDPSANHDIQLEIISNSTSKIFRLSPNDERVVTVGSTASADIQFDSPEVSPIHFYFERTGTEIWIVPAYCVSGLSFNGAEIASPRKLPPQSSVEFANTRLDVHLSMTRDRRFIGPRAAINSCVVEDESSTELSDNDPTQQAWATNSENNVQTRELSVVTVIAPADAPNDRYPNLVAENAGSSSLANTVQISPVKCVHIKRGEQRQCSNLASENLASAAAHIATLPSLNQTLYGVSPSLFGTDNTQLVERVAPRRISRRVPRTSMRTPPRRNSSSLVQLGRLAKRRPITTCLSAIVAALLCSIVVVAVASAILQSRERTSSPRQNSWSFPWVSNR